MGAAVSERELPSFHELVRRFALFDSSASSGCNVQIGANGSVFCKCEGCVRWRDFVEGRDAADAEVKYEVFTREHVRALACYLRARATEFELPVMDVLEVGAGSGRLAHHLNRFLSHEKQGAVVRVTATDSGARGLNGPEVEEEDAIHAISSREAHVVISSWMPRGVDWTAHMRAAPSVREYILIGETDNGICGCPWETWGYFSGWDWSESSDDSEAGDLTTSVTTDGKPSVTTTQEDTCGRVKPQYQLDGWERVELGNLSSLQLCRTDERWSSRRHSHTVAFRRLWAQPNQTSDLGNPVRSSSSYRESGLNMASTMAPNSLQDMMVGTPTSAPFNSNEGDQLASLMQITGESGLQPCGTREGSIQVSTLWFLNQSDPQPLTLS